MLDLYRRTESSGDDAVAFYGNCFLTLAYTGATVVNLLGATSPNALLDGANERVVACGHDSGDCHVIGTITQSGIIWRASGDA